MPKRTRSPEEKRKWEIRRRIGAARDRLPAEERADKSRIIFTRVVQAWEYQQADTVLAYAHFRSEVQTDRLLRATLAAGKRLVLPRVNRQRHELDLYLITDPARQLTPGTWGIPEPDPAQCPRVPLREIGCVIAPGVAFDPWGGRTGYGGGYYDRLLNALSPAQARVCLGLAFEVQIVYEVPRGLFDAHVGAVATELRLVENR
jgi:5-formyltetrahydrofolate cyclo-ligase